MIYFLRLLTALMLAGLFGALTYIAVDTYHYFLSVIAALLGVLSVFIWLKKNWLSYRFLYPGMLCFLLFTIMPIIFTVLISFTNLGTGHFFSKEQARDILLSESFAPKGAAEYTYKLKKNADRYLIETLTPNRLSATFSLADSVQEVKLVHDASVGTENLTSLTLREVYELAPALSKLHFVAPDGTILRYHRTDLLLAKAKTFTSLEDGEVLQNNLSGERYRSNDELGQYESETTGAALLPGHYTVIGLKNYIDLFTKDDFKSTFLKVSTWTVTWALVSVLLTFSLGMSLAIFLNDKNLKAKAIYRNLLILPYSIPFFISVLVFKGMLSKDFGVINAALSQIGIGPIPWLEDALWAKVSCLLVNLWLGFPYMFLITTGILQSIPTSVYEAAKIDGAGRWQSFKKITLPMILTSVTPLLIGSFAFNLGNFVGIYLLTGGGPAMMGTTTPAGETDILISYTYRLAFEGATGQMFGLASSIALFIFVIITILTLINFKLFNVNKNDNAKA